MRLEAHGVLLEKVGRHKKGHWRDYEAWTSHRTRYILSVGAVSPVKPRWTRRHPVSSHCRFDSFSGTLAILTLGLVP